MGPQQLSNLDLVKACDNFPYDEGAANVYYKLYLPGDERPHGYLTRSAVARMPWTSDFHIDHDEPSVRLAVSISEPINHVEYSEKCSAAFAGVVDVAIEQDIFPSLNAQHSEPFLVLGAPAPVQIERFAADLFGITARGAHMTVYTTSPEDGGLRVWVPRRGAHMFTYPNKLDTTVAGGVPAHQTPWDNILQEADEEASLPAHLIIQRAQPVGELTYITRSEVDGCVVPDLLYLYDLEVGQDVIPVPKDGEVKEFYLMTVTEIREALAQGEFKTNSAVVMLEFLMRHGFVTRENEQSFDAILSRMHRVLPFPMLWANTRGDSIHAGDARAKWNGLA